MGISPDIKQELLVAQKTEITEHLVYMNIAKYIKDENNRKIVEKSGRMRSGTMIFGRDIPVRKFGPTGFWWPCIPSSPGYLGSVLASS